MTGPPPATPSGDDTWSLGPATTAAERRAAFAIRRRVFVEGQDCPEDEEFDGLDDASRHVLGRVGDRPVATARWRVIDWQGDRAAKLERFAVLPGYRGRGLGQKLVEHLLAASEGAGLTTAVIHAQSHLVGFYRDLGFTPRGEEFVEAGIPHRLMVRWGDDARGG